MLQISGPLGGKVYNNEVVTPEEFATLFNCPAMKQVDESHRLELLPELIKIDQFGQAKYRRSIAQSCEYNINVSGGLVTVRYYTHKNQVAQGQFRYEPNILTFEGRQNDFSQREYEKFLFLYASPICANSISAAVDPMIQYHDPYAIEAAATAKSERFAKMVDIIQKSPDSDVIAKSRGMNVRGESTNVSSTAGVGLHRAALIGLLAKYQDDFEVAWRDDTVFVRGLAREAMYMGAVKQMAVGARNAWVWSDSNNVIVFIAQGADPFTELISWALSPENYEFAKGALTRAVTGQSQAKPELHPNTPPKAEGQVSQTRDALELAAEKGILWREEGSNTIMYQGSQGPVETRSFSGEDWIANLEQFLKIPGKQVHLTAIKAALNNQ